MDYYDLGTYRRPITTASADAQLWFDRGLLWTYAYNHEEAIACFRRALDHDPQCAMSHWGIAYAVGPNYNKPWEAFEPEEKPAALAIARDAVAAASDLALNSEPAERALIKAIRARYPQSGDVEDFGPFNDAYANEMRLVHGSFPGDPDLSALFAEAVMNRTPWQLWDLQTGAPAEGADTAEAIRVLEQAFSTIEGAWQHVGLLHIYIHLMEMSPHPERALRHGDRLATLAPDAGHLIHMPTHIDVLCGEYENVVSRNQKAMEADKTYLEREGADNFYTLYRCHNFHFKIYGAMFLGQAKTALQAADALIDNLPESVVRPRADWFEGFVPMKQHVLVRFGLWDDILAQPMPDDRTLFSVTTAMMHYARAVALSNTDQIRAAENERDQFFAARDQVPESRMLFNNTCLDILAVAEEMLLGELEYRKGNHKAAFRHLRKSVEIDDALPYDEPWGWMQPTRHALGALLLEQGQLEEAETVYRADLGLDATLARACQHPGNVWSLHGLHECLSRRDETVELLHIKQQLDKAMARAEVPIHASCYCRRSAA
ncbi:MAG: tetratricopeptide repeat protein [Pseudomonadota bacterium]